MFRTAPDLAPVLARIVEKPRRLPRAAMETLAIIAYHQPCTRADIEDHRGVALAPATLELLLDAGLISPAGHRQSPGRPALWATSPEFLVRFGLRSLADLPKRDDILHSSRPGIEALAADHNSARPEPVLNRAATLGCPDRLAAGRTRERIRCSTSNGPRSRSSVLWPWS